ncbi:hypothetical protein [Amycolatopsis sp. cmx-4-54]|uniref:hypothetical protein n=1 Tax=Amycolatopsis sp. cmx-4-54 TaxID=2790936 RepID=UPI00397C75B8
MSITCGNRAGHDDGKPAIHATIDAVRACCTAGLVWACDWLLARTHPEDGETYTVECGGLSWHLPDGRGTTCEFGHSHIYAEVRQDERWDYAEDDEEAKRLARLGVAPFTMDGKPFDIDSDALLYPAGLTSAL